MVSSRKDSESFWAAVKSSRLIGAGLLAAGLLLLITITITIIFTPQLGSVTYGTEISMVLAIIIGSAGLLTVLTVVAVVFSALKLQNRQEALGLPEGSVRAIIAISLIILFVIMSIYLFRSIGPRLWRIEDAAYWNGSAFIPVNGTAYITIEASEDQISIANNLVTTVGTLVVALAGFYFGTRAVTVARGGKDRTLTIISPTKKTYELSPDEEKLEIILKSTPEDESITWETPPEGDKKGSLVQVEPNRFEYRPDTDFKGTATLRFKLRRHPDEKVELEVKRNGEQTAEEELSDKKKPKKDESS